MVSRRFAALAGVAILLSTLAVAPGTGAPPPRPLCDACGATFAETAAEHGVELTVVESTATVRVAENGTATWTVRNTLGEFDPRLRTNESLRTAIADRAMWDTTLLGASLSDEGVLTLRYREPGFAEPSVGGTLRSGAFTERYGYRSLDGLGADRLTVVAPDGMVVDRTVPGANVSADRSRTTLTALDRTGFVTFTQRGDAAGPLWSVLAIAVLLGPVAAANVIVSVGLPAATFGVLVAGLCGVVGRFELDFGVPADRVGAVLGGLGAAVTAGALVSGAASLLGTADVTTFGAGVGVAFVGATLLVPSVRDGFSFRTALVLAAVGLSLAVGTTVVAAPLFQGTGLLRSQTVALSFLVALFAFLPAGFALATRGRRAAVGIAVAGFVVALVQHVPLFTPTVSGASVGLFAGLSIVVVVVCGLPLLLAGRTMGVAADRTVKSRT
jgi:hypothetical protein